MAEETESTESSASSPVLPGLWKKWWTRALLLLCFAGAVKVECLTEFQPPVCLSGGRFINNTRNCYMYDMAALTFNEHESAARKLGGNLPAIENGFNNVQLYDLFEVSPFWIGLTCTSSSLSSCTWSNGKPVSYSNFLAAQPAPYPACYFMSSDLLWRPAECNETKPGIWMVEMTSPYFNDTYARFDAWPLSTLALHDDDRISDCLELRGYDASEIHFVNIPDCNITQGNNITTNDTDACFAYFAFPQPGRTDPRTAILIFRSTSTDAQFGDEARESEMVPFTCPETNRTNGRAHLYFYQATIKMWEREIRDFFKYIIENDIKLDASSYSLGSCLLTLSLSLAELCEIRISTTIEKLYTMGSPRCSDPELAEFHDSLFSGHRVVHRADHIPRLPFPLPELPYRHAYYAGAMAQGESPTLCDGEESTWCSLGNPGNEQNDHVTYFAATDPSTVTCRGD